MVTSLEAERLTKRSSAYQWLYRNADEVRLTYPKTIEWVVLARAASRDGFICKPADLRMAWPRVIRDKQTINPAEAPRQPPPMAPGGITGAGWVRPAAATDRPLLRPATVRNPHKGD
jgi:hypothetical protein